MIIQETLDNYKALVNNIDLIIQKSGMRLNYIESELGMERGTFYYKRKKGKLSVDEVTKLVNILNIDRIEEELLKELAMKGQESGIMKENESATMWSKLAS